MSTLSTNGPDGPGGGSPANPPMVGAPDLPAASGSLGKAEQGPALRDILRAYLTLTKPTILLTVLATGLPGLLLATGDRTLDPVLALATLLGTSLASAGAAAINHYMDRDIDAVMYRTRGRPLPTGVLDPQTALRFGILLSVLATAVLAWWTTPMATALAVGSILYYTVFYTGWLKRRTPQNIVIGGAAGASAPLICWSAVTGDLAWAPVVMFAIIFLWTPPHFWALALFRKEDYASAGVPMLPVVAGEEVTKRQILGYSVIMVLTSLALPVLGAGGTGYVAAAGLLGLGFIWMAWKVMQEASVRNCMRLFTYSIAYLLLLFGAMAVDIGAGRLRPETRIGDLLVPRAEARPQPRRMKVVWAGEASKVIPVTIAPLEPESMLRLGTKSTVTFRVTNHSTRSIAFEAIPHVAPLAADAHFSKLACFCHRVQTLKPRQSKNFNLVYTVDLDLPESIRTVTVSYTLAPTATASHDHHGHHGAHHGDHHH
ncbi:MAG: heme o synthase [Candidatus Sericytochromatia bacterium]|nr:heme o synthase [Candidatus Sericytochromatia bacterium]